MNQDHDQFIQAVQPLFRARRRHAALTVLSLVASLVFAGLNLGVIAPLLLIPIIYFAANMVIADFSLQRKVWQEFARHLEGGDASYTLDQPDHLLGVMGNLAYSLHLHVLASGTSGTRAVRVLQKAIDFKAPHGIYPYYTRWYRILEIGSQQDFYHVFVSSKKNHQPLFPTAMTLLARSIRQNQKLTVEGDVNNFFDIYVPAGSDYEGLITLSPDKLLALRDYGARFDIEFVGNSIYVISRNRIRSIQDVLIYQQEALELINNIGMDLALNQPVPQRELVINQPKRVPFS